MLNVLNGFWSKIWAGGGSFWMNKDCKTNTHLSYAPCSSKTGKKQCKDIYIHRNTWHFRRMGPQHVTPKFSLHQNKHHPKNVSKRRNSNRTSLPTHHRFTLHRSTLKNFWKAPCASMAQPSTLGRCFGRVFGTAPLFGTRSVRNVEASCWRYRVGPLKHLVYNYLGVEMRALNRKVSDDSLLKGWSTKGNEVGWNHDTVDGWNPAPVDR